MPLGNSRKRRQPPASDPQPHSLVALNHAKNRRRERERERERGREREREREREGGGENVFRHWLRAARKPRRSEEKTDVSQRRRRRWLRCTGAHGVHQLSLATREERKDALSNDVV